MVAKRVETAPPWDDLRVLLALHRHRSFLGAGRALGVSTSTAARRISALESALGRTLVQRTSGGTFLEPESLELVTLAEQIELQLRAIRRDEKAEEAVSGVVRVSVGEITVRAVTQTLCELRRVHPGLRLEILSEMRLVDIARREADVALRSSKSSSPSVVHRHLGHARFALYAGAVYIERRLRGGRLKLEDFPRHDFVGFEGPVGHSKTRWLTSRGASRFVVRSNSDMALVEAAASGQGIALLPELVGRATANLVRLDVDAELPVEPMLLAFHRELRNVARVKVVLDALTLAAKDALR